MKKIIFAVIILLIGGMIMSYTRVNWQNAPSTATPVNAENLNTMDKGITEVNSLVNGKADKSELAIERARINSFTSLSEGSTTGDAELIDARVGADGISYANTGSAVRGQIGELRKNIVNEYHANDFMWEIGSIDLNGVNEDFTIVIRTKDIIKITEPIVFHIESGYRYLIFFYNSDNTFRMKTLDYLTSDYILYEGQNVRFVVRRNPDSGVAVVNEMSKQLSIYMQTYMNSSKLNSIAVGFNTLPYKIEHGMLTNGIEANADSFCRTDMIISSKSTVYKVKTGFRMQIVYYKDDGSYWFTGTAKNTEGYCFVPANQKHRLVLSTLPVSFNTSINILNGFYLDSFEQYFHEKQDELLSIGRSLISTDVVLGRLTETGDIETNSYFLTNRNIISFTEKVIIHANDGYLFSVSFYNNDGSHNLAFESRSADLVIPANQKFRFCMRKTNIAVMDSADNRYNVNMTPCINCENPSFSWWNETKWIGHGGAEWLAPINTMASFKAAINQNIKYVETDLRFTSDNVPVLLHGETIDVASNGTGKIKEMTYETVSQYDFGSYFSPDFIGEKIGTLEDLCKIARNANLFIYLEEKVVMTETQVEIVYNILKKYNLLDRVTFGGADIAFIEPLINKFSFPRFQYILGSSEVTNYTDTISKLSAYQKNGNVVISVPFAYTFDANIEKFAEAGFTLLTGEGGEAWMHSLPDYYTEASGTSDFVSIRKNIAIGN